MSILVIADVHGNLEALQAVLKDAAGGYEEIWVLGDVAGYGPDPGCCLDILEAAGAVMVAGNHDLAACGKLGTDYFNAEARAAVEIHRRILSDHHKHVLVDLPESVQTRSVTLAHGNPADPIWGYVLDDTTAADVLNRAETSLTLVGHSHLSGYWLGTPDGKILRKPAVTGLLVDYACALCLANPGSVGQSRDNDPSARYMILNPERKTMVFRKCSWRRGPLRRKMIFQGYPPSLIERMAPIDA